MDNRLPEAFNDFSEARRNGFMEIKNLKDEGKKVVGTYCTYTPWELIMAAGAIPISLCGTSEEPIADAEKDLPRNLCPLIKSSYGFGITDKCPYFFFSDLLVAETTCDGKKKMYELLSKKKPMHIMQLPQTQEGEYSYNLWKKQIILLKERLEKEFNVEITDEKIKEAIKLRNRERIAMQNFYSLSKACPPPMWGLEMLKVLYGATFKTDKEEQIQSIEKLSNDLSDSCKREEGKVPTDAKRILVTGCPIGGAGEKIVKIIEESGGVVVCFENCSGVKSTSVLVDEDKDPIDALTEKYLAIPCSCMSPNPGRIELISKLVDEYNIDGVVDVILQACHTYNVEGYSVKGFVEGEKGIPYISIETDYSQNDVGQLKTRVGAFIEMI